jgi:uncharacterized Zn ribbon protein
MRKERTMQSESRSTSNDMLGLRCDRCGDRASVRSGRTYLCPTCAAPGADESPDDALILCDRCDRESLIRLGEQFLCAACAMEVVRETVEDFEAVTEGPSVEPVEILTWGDRESVLANGLEVGRMVREGTMQLVDAAAAHHQALARSIRRARDTAECVRRIEAGALLFNAWAFSFDARLEDLERQNRALRLVVLELEREVAEFHESVPPS